jgi:hypothetical protein
MADNEDAQTAVEEAEAQPVNKNKRYRRPKDWDTDDIDHVQPPIMNSTPNPEHRS